MNFNIDLFICVIYYISLITFWMFLPVIIIFVSCILCVFMSGVLLYYVLPFTWYFYIIVLSIVGGYMVLLSFVIMTIPNMTNFFVSDSQFVSQFIPVLCTLFPIIICFISEDISLQFSMFDCFINKFCLENFISFSPFCVLLLFLVLMILFMLLIIDGIVVTGSGSMLI